ncbi:hypothetical protein D3C84_1112030 [compost metagenome]
MRHGRLHQRLHIRRDRYVAALEQRLATGPLDLGDQGEAHVLIHVRHHHLGAGFGEQLRRGRAHALGRAGDDGYLSFKHACCHFDLPFCCCRC